MSPKSLVLSGKDLLKKLKVLGFEVSRVKGSHHFLKHQDGRSVVVPVHGNEVLGRGLIKQIVKNTKIETSDLV